MSSNRHRVPFLVLGLLVLIAPASPVAADEEADPSQLVFKTDRVVVFKDGHALFVRKGKATVDKDGRVFTLDVPDAAVLGTVWAFTPDKQMLGMHSEAVRETRTETTSASCVTMSDLLRENRGKRVTLELTDGRAINGQVAEVLERTVDSQPPVFTHQGNRREIVRTGGSLVKLTDTPMGDLVLPVSDVRMVSANGLDTTTERVHETAKITKRLSFDLGPEAAGKPVDVTLMFFASGLRWIPTYRISGALEDQAEMALQAEILNEAEDLEDVAVDLVVGVPHFRFKEVVSPLALEAQLRNALRQAAPQLMGQVSMASNTFFSSRAGEVVDRPDPGLPLDLAPELLAGGSQDLFVYSVPRMTLGKGARATLPLWQSTAPLTHLYTLDVHLGRQAESGGAYIRVPDRNDFGTPLELASYLVWHQLELTNRSDVPWTTGAALTVKGTLPLGQDLLGYTPVGGRSLLPLTQAVDVRAGLKEEETSREPNVLTVGRTKYSRIHKRATFTVQNFRGETSLLRVRLALGGRVTSGSHDARIVVNDYRPDDWARHSADARVNHHSDVEWNVEVGAGQTIALVCDYEFFIR